MSMNSMRRFHIIINPQWTRSMTRLDLRHESPRDEKREELGRTQKGDERGIEEEEEEEKEEEEEGEEGVGERGLALLDFTVW